MTEARMRQWIIGLVPAAALVGAVGAMVVMTTFSAAQSPAGKSLYARLGGYDGLAAVTDEFIGRLATDPRLGKFFVGHSEDSLHRIRQLFVDQLCAATGGPCFYIGRDMKTVHKGLGISEEDWTAAVNDLTATLDKFKVGGQERNEIFALLAKLKPDIVEKP